MIFLTMNGAKSGAAHIIIEDTIIKAQANI